MSAPSKEAMELAQKIYAEAREGYLPVDEIALLMNQIADLRQQLERANVLIHELVARLNANQ